MSKVSMHESVVQVRSASVENVAFAAAATTSSKREFLLPEFPK